MHTVVRSARPFGPGDGGGEAEIGARGPQPVGDQFRGEGLDAGQQPGLTRDERDLRAERLPGRGHLGGDHARTENDQSAGHRAGAGGLPARPRAHRVQPRQRRQRRSGAGAHGHRVPGGEIQCRAVRGLDRHLSFAGDPPVPALEGDARRAEPVDLVAVVPVGGHAIAVFQDGRGVEGPGERRGDARYPAGFGVQQSGAQQRFAGFASPVGAFAADQLGFHDNGAQSGGAGSVGHILADRAGPEDHDVVGPRVLVCHDSAFVSVVSGRVPAE